MPLFHSLLYPPSPLIPLSCYFSTHPHISATSPPTLISPLLLLHPPSYFSHASTNSPISNSPISPTSPLHPLPNLRCATASPTLISPSWHSSTHCYVSHASPPDTLISPSCYSYTHTHSSPMLLLHPLSYPPHATPPPTLIYSLFHPSIKCSTLFFHMWLCLCVCNTSVYLY